MVNALSVSYGDAKKIGKTADNEVLELYDNLKNYILSLGDAIQLQSLKHYYAFKRLRNFVCVEILPRRKALVLSLNIDPKETILEEGFARNVSNIGHLGTGDLQITIQSIADFYKAKDLILQSYENS